MARASRYWIVLTLVGIAAILVYGLDPENAADGNAIEASAGRAHGDPRSDSGVGLRMTARRNPSDRAARRRRLALLVRAKQVVWQKVADALEFLDGPVDPEVRSILLNELRSGRRNEAMVAFEALHDATLVADLIALFDDPLAPRGASRAALKALSRMPGADADRVARLLGQRLTGDVNRDGELLAAIARCGGTQGVRVLVSYMESLKGAERIPHDILVGIFRTRSPATERVVLEALGREQSRSALHAILRLVAVTGGTGFTEALIDLDRREGSAPVRADILTALACIGGARAVSYLLARSDEAGPGGEAAARALVHIRMGDAKAREQLMWRLERADRAPHTEQIKRSVLRTLASLAHKEALPLIVEHLDDPSLRVRHAALRALGRLGPGARACVGTLGRLLDEGEHSLRLAAVVALGRIGGAKALRLLRRIPMKAGASPSLRRAVQQGIEAASRIER